MESKNCDRNIFIELNKNEALVLFEWLHTLNEQESLFVVHGSAEQRILFDLESVLESALPEILSEHYAKILNNARKDIVI